MSPVRNIHILYVMFPADVNLLQSHVPHMIQFIEHIASDEDASDGVVAASCGLIG